MSLVLYSSSCAARSQKSNCAAKNSRRRRTGAGQRHRHDLAGRSRSSSAGVKMISGGTISSGRDALLDAGEQLAQEARVEVERLDHDVDAVLERLDDLVGAAAHVVVGGEEPGALRALHDLVEDLGVAVGQQREQRRLRARRDAVVLVDDLDPHRQPLAPGDADVLHAARPAPGRAGRGLPSRSAMVICGWPCWIARRTSLSE